MQKKESKIISRCLYVPEEKYEHKKSSHFYWIIVDSLFKVRNESFSYYSLFMWQNVNLVMVVRSTWYAELKCSWFQSEYQRVGWLLLILSANGIQQEYTCTVGLSFLRNYLFVRGCYVCLLAVICHSVTGW